MFFFLILVVRNQRGSLVIVSISTMSEERQIQSMIDFIEREAQEKAEELDAAAQEEYDVEKMRLVEAEKAKIRANLEKKKKQVEVERRVTRANYAKSQRLRLMDERAGILDELNATIKKKITDIINDKNAYQKLLLDLVRQSLRSIQADSIVECRKQDEQIISKAIGELQTWYQKESGKAVTITLNKTSNLDDAEAWGGVILRSSDGRIVCNNTLSYRAHYCFREQAPTVRYFLFNPEAPI